jgi:hypothetical protein
MRSEFYPVDLHVKNTTVLYIYMYIHFLNMTCCNSASRWIWTSSIFFYRNHLLRYIGIGQIIKKTIVIPAYWSFHMLYLKRLSNLFLLLFLLHFVILPILALYSVLFITNIEFLLGKDRFEFNQRRANDYYWFLLVFFIVALFYPCHCFVHTVILMAILHGKMCHM